MTDAGAAARFDLVLKGGRVIDERNRVDAVTLVEDAATFQYKIVGPTACRFIHWWFSVAFGR